MPMIDIDSDPQVLEPIQVLLNGETYTVQPVSQAVMEQIDTVTGEGGASVLSKQLSILLGVDAAIFDTLDIRKAGVALTRIMEAVTGGYTEQSKNG